MDYTHTTQRSRVQVSIQVYHWMVGQSLWSHSHTHFTTWTDWLQVAMEEARLTLCGGLPPITYPCMCTCNATPPNQNHSPLTHQTPVRTLPGQHVSCQVIKMVFPQTKTSPPLTHQTPVRTLPGQHVSCQVIKMVFPQTKTSPPSLTRHLLEHCQDNMCPVK